MLCWNIVLFNFLAFFPIHLKQPRRKYLCRWANLYLLLHWSARKMCIPNASVHNVFLTCSYIAFFCFVFLWGEKINSGETTDVWNPATCIKKPLPTWCEEDNNIQFTLQVCVLWHFQFSVRFIYLYVIIHKGLPSLWMCGISLWWIMCTLQFITNKSLVITQLRQHLRIHHLWCLIPMLKCNDMPLTYILCPLPQLSFVFFFLQLHQ